MWALTSLKNHKNIKFSDILGIVRQYHGYKYVKFPKYFRTKKKDIIFWETEEQAVEFLTWYLSLHEQIEEVSLKKLR